MIANLKPYAAYKDSGVPWLGEVPEHWEMVPLRRMASGFKNGTSAEQISSGTTAFPVSRIETISTGAINYDKVGFIREGNVDPRFWLQPGDILLSHINSFEMVGNCAQFLGERPLLHGMNLIRIRPKNRAVGAFMFRFMKSAAFRYEMRALCKPAINQVSVTTTAIKGIHMPLPPLPEQTAIVRFLDYMDRRIRRYIRAKQKLIKLLEEYKQTLIHQAVTGKIDVRTGQPYPAYKDSGVQWLGQVPEHWEVVKLKFISKRMQNGSTPPTDVGEYYADQGIPWYGPSSLLEEILIGLPVRFVTERAILDNKVRVIQPPALVISVIGNVGKSALMLELGATNQQLTCCELDQKICNPVFVVNQFRMAEHYLVASASSTTIAILDSEVLRNMPLAISPLPEQTAIVEYLDAQTARLDAAMAATRREIELLREYRTRLIADVVTGKVDVREIAAQLPEETEEETEPLEEETTSIEETDVEESEEETDGEE